MEENNKDNVTIGLPKEGGAIFWAPAGTTLPTSADEELSEDFENLGYVTSDGVTMSTEEETEDIEAWGKDVVMSTQTSYSRSGSFNLMESSRVAALQFIYGKENVTLKDDGAIEWLETGEVLPRGVLVVDTIHNNGSASPRIHRQVLGDCQFVDRSGDQVYNNSEAVTYPVSIKAFKFTPSGGSKPTYVLNMMTSANPTPTA